MPKLSLLNALAQAKLDADPNKNLMDWAKLPAVPNSARVKSQTSLWMKIFSGESFCKPFNAFFQGECPKFRPILWITGITHKEAFETH
jgi:hypothetical protein